VGTLVAINADKAPEKMTKAKGIRWKYTLRVAFTALLVVSVTSTTGIPVNGQKSRYFVIQVIDEQTGRGVPLVKLKFINEVTYWTDSAGIAAIDEPSLRGRDVFLEITSDGYEHPRDKFFERPGVSVRIEPGRSRQIKIRRLMIAERLFRLTGEGIYRDSILVGRRAPSKEPLLNGQVLGQDTVSAAIYRGKLFWIWGDTFGPAYANFNVTAAVSDLRDNPAVAINYHYFTDKQDRVKPMLLLSRPGLVWIEGLIPMTDDSGDERLVATYTRQHGLGFPDECGLALFDDQAQVFNPWIEMPCTKPHLSSHPFLHNGYWYLYPSLRVRNDWKAIQDYKQWETRDVQLPANAKRPSCVVWNKFRQRWILLLEDTGKVLYAEAKQPEGPYGKAVEIIRHDHYNFYNVVTHGFFNQDGGRTIFIEGTYTDSFSDAKEKTPRYNYNQLMYRLHVDDPRLRHAHN